uniref:Derlin n=1 Tax=Percolomonas cosmopolitus TaxID=63605 RepID=A0A7S1PJ09_9EUKA|mmetsp:Transcript_8260/g.30531  ORF Transcript_8260/g.30531 Transcript_8260/m.30531 type:complete len:209 (+) Transcript_8260:154-780(+)
MCTLDHDASLTHFAFVRHSRSASFRRLCRYFYCRRLEEHSFHNKHADFLVMILFACTMMLLIAPLLNLPFLSHSLIVMILYVWSRRNPTEQLRLYGLFLIPASYLPYILLGISILMGNGIWVDILGMLVGHMYYFLNDVIPQTFGIGQPLTAPKFLRKVFREYRDDEIIETRDQLQPTHEDRPIGGGLVVDDEDEDDENAWNIEHNED